MARRFWGWFLAALVVSFLGLMAWSLHRAGAIASPVVEEYLRDRP